MAGKRLQLTRARKSVLLQHTGVCFLRQATRCFSLLRGFIARLLLQARSSQGVALSPPSLPPSLGVCEREDLCFQVSAVGLSLTRTWTT